MSSRHLVMGLQAAGKTTFAAALWHLIEAAEVPTVMKKGLHRGDYSYLDAMAKLWADGWKVKRTDGDQVEPVIINLIDKTSNNEVKLEFSDISGETFEKAYATRDISGSLPHLLEVMDGIIVFVTADSSSDDTSLVDLGLAAPDVFSESEDDEEDEDGDASAQARTTDVETPFDPAKVPKQVQVVDLLQAWEEAPVSRMVDRLVVIISAWDLVKKKTPGEWLIEKMPLLAQYLSARFGQQGFRVYGVSAQGGVLTKDMKAGGKTDRLKLLAKSKASERIVVEGHGAPPHDLTHPIRWLSKLE